MMNVVASSGRRDRILQFLDAPRRVRISLDIRGALFNNPRRDFHRVEDEPRPPERRLYCKSRDVLGDLFYDGIPRSRGGRSLLGKLGSGPVALRTACQRVFGRPSATTASTPSPLPAIG